MVGFGGVTACVVGGAGGCLCPAVTVLGERWIYWHRTSLVLALIVKVGLLGSVWV